jgi:hypothetical protein
LRSSRIHADLLCLRNGFLQVLTARNATTRPIALALRNDPSGALVSVRDEYSAVASSAHAASLESDTLRILFRRPPCRHACFVRTGRGSNGTPRLMPLASGFRPTGAPPRSRDGGTPPHPLIADGVLAGRASALRIGVIGNEECSKQQRQSHERRITA